MGLLAYNIGYPRDASDQLDISTVDTLLSVPQSCREGAAHHVTYWTERRRKDQSTDAGMVSFGEGRILEHTDHVAVCERESIYYAHQPATAKCAVSATVNHAIFRRPLPLRE